MKEYKITWGSFGSTEVEIIEFESESDAEKYAWSMAKDEYEGYVGLHGIRTVDEIMEEDELDIEDAEITFMEEMESFLYYTCELYKK